MSKRQRTVFHVILFYNYRVPGSVEPIKDIRAFCDEHRSLCEDLGLTGRVLIAEEGINGTLSSSSRSQLDKYTEWLKASQLFTLQESDFKRSTASQEPFPDLFVKVVSEIINTGGVIPVPKEGQGGVHLSPEEFHAKLQRVSKVDNTGSSNESKPTGTETHRPKETVLIDVRTHKEYMVGRFKGAIDPKLRTFSEFPAYLNSQASNLRGKTVLMYCTGGIRCEKASFHLKKLGVEDVYQLKGGIHKYLEKYPDGGNWEGKNFVFDKRVFQPTPEMKPEASIVGKCYECEAPFDELSGAAVCTVCRDMVLVCHSCRPRLRYEYHCVHHRHLKDLYFTDLSSFTKAELESQKNGLEKVLINLGEGGDGKGGVLKKTKNKRRTLRKQIARIGEAISEVVGQQDANDSHGKSPRPTQHFEEGERKQARGVKRKRNCRTCGKTSCKGTCWGIWKEDK